jgi:hypothetical protein
MISVAEPDRDVLDVNALAHDAGVWDEGDNRPETAAVARMHPLTLRFDGDREGEFTAEYFERTLVQVRLAFLLALALYTVFGVLDTWTAPAERNRLWFIRYAVIAPILIGAIVFTYKPLFLRFRDETTSMVTLFAALGIVVMTAVIPPPGSYLYYAGLLLAIMFAFTLVRLTVPYATAVSAITVGA